jgi:hypothetical protein
VGQQVPAPQRFLVGAMATTLLLAALRQAIAGPPYVTDDPVPVEVGHWEFYGLASGTIVHGDSAGILPGIDANYGALPNLQLHLLVTDAYNSQSLTGTQFGYGDMAVGAKVRFIEAGDDDWWPQVATYPQIAAPTGDAARGLGTGRVHDFLPLWLEKTIGGFTLDAGGGLTVNPGPGNKNYWLVGLSVQHPVADGLTIGGEFFHQTATTTGAPGVGFPLGSKDVTGFNFGFLHDITEHYHLLASAGRGLQNVAASDEVSYYLALQWTF